MVSLTFCRLLLLLQTFGPLMFLYANVTYTDYLTGPGWSLTSWGHKSTSTCASPYRYTVLRATITNRLDHWIAWIRSFLSVVSARPIHISTRHCHYHVSEDKEPSFCRWRFWCWASSISCHGCDRIIKGKQPNLSLSWQCQPKRTTQTVSLWHWQHLNGPLISKKYGPNNWTGVLQGNGRYCPPPTNLKPREASG